MTFSPDEENDEEEANDDLDDPHEVPRKASSKKAPPRRAVCRKGNQTKPVKAVKATEPLAKKRQQWPSISIAISPRQRLKG